MDRERSEIGRKIGEEKEVKEKLEGGERHGQGDKDQGGRQSVFKPSAIQWKVL